EGDGHGLAREVAERGLVYAVGEEARLLKLYREEEGRARVYALRVAAARVRAARLDVIVPESHAGSVAVAVEEVVVVLAHEEVRNVYGVSRVVRVVEVCDGEGRGRGRAEYALAA